VQPIGGVNQKIEGFYDICRLRGLTGRQGVIIPLRNVEDLMLREDVVEAVAAGKFRIFTMENIDQGIEILMGVRAGKMEPNGKFEEGSVFAAADKRLRQMAESLRDFETSDRRRET